MARSATTGFFERGGFYSNVEPAVTQQLIIANSATIKIGDAVRVNTAGFIVRAAAGEPILGVVSALTDRDGLNVFTPQAQGLTGTALTPDDQVVVSSTNQSDASRNVSCLVEMDPAGTKLWFNDADSTLAATNLFQFFDNNSSGNQITVSTASDTSGQWQLVKLDPDGDADASKGLFRIAEGILGGMVDAGTAKITA